MQWFKHHNNFRNSPAMKHVEAQMGDVGVAAVYRLYEVFTERFGANSDFTGSLTLSAPFSEQWLASEILRRPWDEENNRFGDAPKVADLLFFLGVCETARIVTLERVVDGITKVDTATGEHVETGENKTWVTVTIPGFAALADEYATNKSNRLKKSLALETTR
jgi:hypothetical protein